MNTKQRLSPHLFRAATVAVMAMAGVALYAQQTLNLAELRQPAGSLFAAPNAGSESSLNLADDGIAYSSSTGASELAVAKRFCSHEQC